MLESKVTKLERKIYQNYTHKIEHITNQLIVSNNNMSYCDNVVKGDPQFIFLCNPLKCLFHENIKRHRQKKVIVCFYNLGEENFIKVTAFIISPTSIMVLV